MKSLSLLFRGVGFSQLLQSLAAAFTAHFPSGTTVTIDGVRAKVTVSMPESSSTPAASGQASSSSAPATAPGVNGALNGVQAVS